MEYTKIRLEFAGGVAILTLDDQPVMNAAGPTMLAEIRHALGQVRQSPDTRCLLMTGVGRGFCTGANLLDASAAQEGPRSFDDSLRFTYHPILLTFRNLDMPVITAINGPAVGAGVGFALVGDLILASKEAYFLQSFVRIGLAPDAGTTYCLARRVGWGRAIEMSMLAEKIPAEQALAWGLINRLFDDQAALAAGAKELAQRLANGPRSLVETRRLFWKTWENSFSEQLDLEAVVQQQAGMTTDAVEGISAFLEKRKPNFTGK